MVSSQVALIGALLFAHCAYAEVSGKVIGIADGDTLTLLSGREQIKVNRAKYPAEKVRGDSRKYSEY